MVFQISSNNENDEKVELITNQSNKKNLNHKLKSIDNTLKKIWDTINDRATEEIKEIKWKYAAVVFDKIFLIISIVYFLLTFCPYLLSIKNLYKPIYNS